MTQAEFVKKYDNVKWSAAYRVLLHEKLKNIYDDFEKEIQEAKDEGEINGFISMFKYFESKGFDVGDIPSSEFIRSYSKMMVENMTPVCSKCRWRMSNPDDTLICMNGNVPDFLLESVVPPTWSCPLYSRGEEGEPKQ